MVLHLKVWKSRSSPALQVLKIPGLLLLPSPFSELVFLFVQGRYALCGALGTELSLGLLGCPARCPFLLLLEGKSRVDLASFEHRSGGPCECHSAKMSSAFHF